MGDRRILLKSLCDTSFYKDLSNEAKKKFLIRGENEKNPIGKHVILSSGEGVATF
jgi:hypothetical protein